VCSDPDVCVQAPPQTACTQPSLKGERARAAARLLPEEIYGFMKFATDATKRGRSRHGLMYCVVILYTPKQERGGERERGRARGSI